MSFKTISILFLTAGIFAVVDASAQSNVKAVEKQVVSTPVEQAVATEQNPDVAPAQAEKPYVTGDNGEKIYFLTDPGKSSENVSPDKKTEEKIDPPAPK